MLNLLYSLRANKTVGQIFLQVQPAQCHASEFLLGEKGHFHTKTILLDLSLYAKSFSTWPSCCSVSITMSQAVHWKALSVLLQVTSVLVMGLAVWMDNHKLFSLSFWQYCLCLALSLRAWALHYPGWTHDLAARSLRRPSLCIMFPIQLSFRQAL